MTDRPNSPDREDIIQAATGGPDFTVKEWPTDRPEGLSAEGRAFAEALLTSPFGEDEYNVTVPRSLLRALLDAARDSRPVGEGRPEIVCLCGSTRFYDEFQAANYDLTMLGKIVLSVGFYPHALTKHGHGEGVGHDSSEKITLDELHKRKIDLADRVYVLNVNGYIGDSTRSEIEYAEAHGKPVDYLEPGWLARLSTDQPASTEVGEDG